MVRPTTSRHPAAGCSIAKLCHVALKAAILTPCWRVVKISVNAQLSSQDPRALTSYVRRMQLCRRVVVSQDKFEEEWKVGVWLRLLPTQAHLDTGQGLPRARFQLSLISNNSKTCTADDCISTQGNVSVVMYSSSMGHSSQGRLSCPGCYTVGECIEIAVGRNALTKTTGCRRHSCGILSVSCRLIVVPTAAAEFSSGSSADVMIV